MPKFVDLTGETYSRLTVVKAIRTYPGVRFLCRCSCGGSTVTTGTQLKSGHTRSCGCVRKERIAEEGRKCRIHGLKGNKLYKVLKEAMRRCEDTTNKAYKNYGGRGITVCEEWRNDPQAFVDWSIKNGWEPGLQLDREDNNLGYDPNNCRFVTSLINCHNSRKRCNNNSGYSGVWKHMTVDKFVSSITHGDSRVYLGLHETKEQAVQARNEFIIKNNLPHKIQELK